MLRVLIADDEARICQLIQALGDWERLGLEVAGAAHNGQEALEKTEALRPDILITDIRMPGLNGLELIRRVKTLFPKLEVMIISGYAQFDYAQQALRNGVGEYLLKPINREALNRTLEKMADAIRERQRNDSAMQSIQAAGREDWGRLRRQTAADLWRGSGAPASMEELRRHHFRTDGDSFQTFLLKADIDAVENPDRFLQLVFQKARELLAPLLKKSCVDAVLYEAGDTLLGVVCLSSDEESALRSQLRSVLNQLVAQKSLFGAVEFTIGLGKSCRDPSGLGASLNNARQALQERLIEGAGRLLEGQFPPSGVLETDLQTRYSQAALHAVDVLSAEGADAASEQLQKLSDYPRLRGWEALAIAQNAGRLFITYLGTDEADKAYAAYEWKLMQCNSLPQLWARLQEMQRGLLRQTVLKRQERELHPIRNAKLYVQKHYAEPLTLESVSTAIGFSVNYFSTLFKKETGEGFSKYLTRIRMDQARSLLRETGVSVAEVCGRVGYCDVKHFSKTFKAETGLTPGEYRKLYG